MYMVTCIEEYFIEFYREKFLKSSLLLAVLPWNLLEPFMQVCSLFTVFKGALSRILNAKARPAKTPKPAVCKNQGVNVLAIKGLDKQIVQIYSRTAVSQNISPKQPSNSKHNIWTVAAHTARKRTLFFCCMLTHALPGIVDGARKRSHVGRWVRSGGRERSCRFSSSPMLEATSSRNQRINVAPSIVYHVKIYLLLSIG